MTACLACKVLDGRIQPPGGAIYEDEHWVVDHSISPVRLKGWLIIKPKRYVEDLADLSPVEAASISPLASAASLAVREGLGPNACLSARSARSGVTSTSTSFRAIRAWSR
jgi:diadenosine tetraphosphate (Ap4A) HIT family hydrolase